MKLEDKLIRTFLSVPVPIQVGSKKNMLYSTLDEKFKVNWVKNNNLHLTIKFLDFTKESAIPELLLEINKITSTIKPFNLKIEKTGCFPNKEKAKILWLGVTGILDPLAALFNKFEIMLQEYGFPKEEMEFNPHVTIARIKYPQKLTPDVNLFLNSNFDPIKFPINRVQFLSSELISTGVVYTLIKSFPLGESLTKEK